jgi:hypothetical protein
VFVNVADPVGAGLVESLARPGGNTTGFTNFEYSMSGKWVELLKQIAPRVTRVAVLRDSAAPVKTQQDVIVAVEDRYASKRCHQRCSVAESFKIRPLPDRSLVYHSGGQYDVRT